MDEYINRDAFLSECRKRYCDNCERRKGMEMPKDKPLRIVLNPNGQTFVDHSTWFDEYEAVEIHTPHGRLIDADAYETQIRGLGNREYRRQNGTICDAIKFLHPDYAPTIIEAESEVE